MRVLLATPYKISSGGISRWAEHIVNYHRDTNSGIELDILPLNDTKNHVAKDFVHKTPFERLMRGIRTYLNASKRLNRELKNRKYDIVHIVSSATWGLLKDIVMMKIAQRRGVKSVVHFHFGRIPELAKQQNWEWKMLCYVVRHSDKTIVIDRLSYGTLQQNGFTNVEYIPNPLSTSVNDIIQSIGNVERQSRRLMFAGQCVAAKGVYELVEACSVIPDIELRIFGAITSDMKRELESKWNSDSTLSIMDNQPFETILKEMCQCDVFVLPTHTEGFPNVILESMACGCAIVTTPVGAIPEMLEEEDGKRYGIMVEPRNVNQLKSAIEKMLSDEEFKAQCRINVQQRVNERYNIESVWHKMVEMWHRTISNS